VIKLQGAASELLALCRNLILEAAKARFEKNFGTVRCDTCDGLKAGPGIVATCFQVRQCFYGNIKADASPRHERLIEILTKGSNIP
jgi:hypothetical protein